MSKRACVIALAALLMLTTGCPADRNTPLPCDVDQVLEDKCRVCHGAPVAFGAPIELVVWEDTQDTIDSEPVWKIMERRIRDPDEPMPPRGLDRLTVDELAILDAWFQAGAPALAVDSTCP